MATRSSNRSRSLGPARRKRPRNPPPPAPRRSSADFDPIKTAGLIEACRAHVASLAGLADNSMRTLFELYEHEGDEPELWQCCRLVCHVLKQTQAVFTTLGLVSPETESLAPPKEIAWVCETQRQWVRPTIHVIRATIHVLIDLKTDFLDEVLPALRSLEVGLSKVVSEIQDVIQCCPWRSTEDAAMKTRSSAPTGGTKRIKPGDRRGPRS